MKEIYLRSNPPTKGNGVKKVMNPRYKQLEGEANFEYGLRLITIKIEERPTDLDWQDIVDVLGLECHRDSLRKATSVTEYSAYKVMLYFKEKIAQITKESSEDSANEYIRELEDKIIEFKKEQVKSRDERNQLNKKIREQARKESLIELVKRTVLEYSPIKYDYSPVVYKKDTTGDNDMIVHLTDLHTGLGISNYFNTFDVEELKRRINNYFDEVALIQKLHKSQNCYLVLGGDLISGLIHVSTRIENNENVVEQIMIASDVISNFAFKLSKIFNNVEVYSTSGNHSRSTASKDESLKGENFDNLIPYVMEKALQQYENIIINENILDEGICSFEVRGHFVVGAHGDKDTAKNIVQNMTMLLGRKPDIAMLGHRHTNGLTTVHNTKVVESGCVDGMDSYCIDRRLSGTPEQMVLVVSEKKKIECLYDVQLI